MKFNWLIFGSLALQILLGGLALDIGYIGVATALFATTVLELLYILMIWLNNE